MLNKKWIILQIIIISCFLILYGCNLFDKQKSTTDLDYKELKQMVIDILQTEDSKKIIQDSIQDPNVKKELILNDEEIKGIVENELLSPENKDKLKSFYEDPKFVAELGKILKEENKNLLKDLMKDPEYRKMMLETMQNKEFEEMIIKIMKSNEYRTQMMVVIKDSLQSPMFKEDLMKLLEEASKNALKNESEQDKKNEKEQPEEQK